MPMIGIHDVVLKWIKGMLKEQIGFGSNVLVILKVKVL